MSRHITTLIGTKFPKATTTLDNKTNRTPYNLATRAVRMVIQVRGNNKIAQRAVTNGTSRKNPITYAEK